MPDYQNKYINAVGLKHLWDRIAETFQRKEPGKVLSDNNYSDEEKEKLEKIDSLSNYELDLITGSASTVEALKSLFAVGGKIHVAKNLSISDQIVVTTDTVIDLRNHDLTFMVDDISIVADGASITFKNGNIVALKNICSAVNGGHIIIQSGNFESEDVGFIAVGTGSGIIVNGGTLSAQSGVLGVCGGGEIEINNGCITGEDGPAVFTCETEGYGGSTVTINGGEIVGNVESDGYISCGVYIANDDSLVMNDGIVISNDGCGILMRGGSVQIHDGEIIARKEAGTNTPGWVKDTDNLMSASALIYHETANYPGNAGMSLTVTGGTFEGTDHSVEILSNEVSPSVTISGGIFSPAYIEP